MSTDPICRVICHLCGAPHKSNFLFTSMVMRGVRGVILNYYLCTSLVSFVQDRTLFVGSCVQRALVSCDQPADALCTIVSITDNFHGCKIAGCNPQQHSHAYYTFFSAGWFQYFIMCISDD